MTDPVGEDVSVMSDKRSCPVAPDGRELPWHVHDDWYAEALASSQAREEELTKERDQAWEYRQTALAREEELRTALERIGTESCFDMTYEVVTGWSDCGVCISCIARAALADQQACPTCENPREDPGWTGTIEHAGHMDDTFCLDPFHLADQQEG